MIPSHPAGYIECRAHIERKAYIENPKRDLSVSKKGVIARWAQPAVAIP